jgi:hypothetical protein
MTSLFGRIGNWMNSGGLVGQMGGFGGMFSKMGGWLSGLIPSSNVSQQKGLPVMSLASALSAVKMQDGGVIREHVVGQGLRSGNIYEFGEESKYGVNEIVAPMDKISKGGGSPSIHFHMTNNINSIDTQTGTEFLTKNTAVIERNIAKVLRNNKKLRNVIRTNY